MQGLDGCKRMGLDDKLAIAFILNTAKQETTTFLKTLQTFNMTGGHFKVGCDHHMACNVMCNFKRDAIVKNCDVASFFNQQPPPPHPQHQ